MKILPARYRGRYLAPLLMIAGTTALAAPPVSVPAGTPLRTVIRQTIRTDTARRGDAITAELTAPLEVNGRVVAPEGSRVEGHVVSVTASGRLGRPAYLEFGFDQLIPTGGRPVKIVTSHYARTGDSHTKRDVGYIAGGAAVGAILGQVLGKNTQSTLEGAAAGAAAGTGLAAATGELDFEVEAGRVITLQLRKPILLR